MLTVPDILAQLDDLTAAQCKECIAALKPHLMAAARARDTDTERTIQDCVDKLEARREALLADGTTAHDASVAGVDASAANLNRLIQSRREEVLDHLYTQWERGLDQRYSLSRSPPPTPPDAPDWQVHHYTNDAGCVAAWIRLSTVSEGQEPRQEEVQKATALLKEALGDRCDIHVTQASCDVYKDRPAGIFVDGVVQPEPTPDEPRAPDEPASEPEPAPKPRPNLGRGRPRKIQNGKVVEGQA